MKKKIYPKSRILASSMLKKTLTQKVSELVESTFESNLAQQISSIVPDYDLDWCPEEYNADSKEAKELKKARDLYTQAIVYSLLANAPEDIKSATRIQGSSSEWTYLSSKSVPDSDGFYTDYTLYTNLDRSKFICMFGDNDLYEPDEDYADFETEVEDEAWEWFNSYEGIIDDDEDSGWMNDIISSTSSSSQKHQNLTSNGLGSFVLKTKTWSEMIKALKDKGLSVDASYHRRPEKHISLIQNEESPESKKYWVAEVTQYFNGDYEIRSDNIFRDSYYDE